MNKTDEMKLYDSTVLALRSLRAAKQEWFQVSFGEMGVLLKQARKEINLAVKLAEKIGAKTCKQS
ncbi:MAG: hypothetical protein LBK76_09935 [Verrucomicrobiales bacterium]|jgi:hypothetical protein|nr:hypothetical protein [Verrucomicrobiales bacterium]